jgi:dTDP-4-dehydrorhamnose 3,5-epimerase
MHPHGPGYDWQDQLPIPGVRCLTPGQRRLIAGVKVRRLPSLPDERGVLTEVLRSDDPEYSQFGQVYLTTTYPGVVKGWHRHERQTDMICCVSGDLKLVLYRNADDDDHEGLVNEIFLGDANRAIIKVPSGVWHGWKCVGTTTALVMNIPDQVYDYSGPDEIRLDPHDNDIPYDWARRDG